METFWLWLWWWVFDPTRFLVGFIWIALIIGVLLVERRRKKLHLPPPKADPTCPTCGYLLVGLPGTICPECGSELTVVGVRRSDDPSTSPAARILLWTILFALPASLAWRYIEPRLPKLRESKGSYMYGGPISNAYKSITLTRTIHEWVWPGTHITLGSPTANRAGLDCIEIRLTLLNGAERTYTWNAPTLSPSERLRYFEQARAATKPSDVRPIFDRNALEGWVGAQGIDAKGFQVRDELSVVATGIDELISDYGFSRTPAEFGWQRVLGGGGFYGRPRWMFGGWIGICFLVWLIGARLASKRPTLPFDRVPPALSGTCPTSPGAIIGP